MTVSPPAAEVRREAAAKAPRAKGMTNPAQLFARTALVQAGAVAASPSGFGRPETVSGS